MTTPTRRWRVGIAWGQWWRQGKGADMFEKSNFRPKGGITLEEIAERTNVPLADVAKVMGAASAEGAAIQMTGEIARQFENRIGQVIYDAVADFPPHISILAMVKALALTSVEAAKEGREANVKADILECLGDALDQAIEHQSEKRKAITEVKDALKNIFSSAGKKPDDDAPEDRTIN